MIRLSSLVLHPRRLTLRILTYTKELLAFVNKGDDRQEDKRVKTLLS
jgi:hypothetical protein